MRKIFCLDSRTRAGTVADLATTPARALPPTTFELAVDRILHERVRPGLIDGNGLGASVFGARYGPRNATADFSYYVSAPASLAGGNGVPTARVEIRDDTGD